MYSIQNSASIIKMCNCMAFNLFVQIGSNVTRGILNKKKIMEMGLFASNYLKYFISLCTVKSI